MTIKKVSRCLIIDDDAVSRYLAQEAIQEINLAQQIVTANNGMQALDYIKEHCLSDRANCPELIILDIKMPVMDGHEFLQELAMLEDLKHNNTSIILYSSAAYQQEKEKLKGQFPILGYMEKPITSEKLIEILSN